MKRSIVALLTIVVVLCGLTSVSASAVESGRGGVGIVASLGADGTSGVPACPAPATGVRASGATAEAPTCYVSAQCWSGSVSCSGGPTCSGQDQDCCSSPQVQGYVLCGASYTYCSDCPYSPPAHCKPCGGEPDLCGCTCRTNFCGRVAAWDCSV